MIIFINGKQKRVRRPQLIEGLPADEFIAQRGFHLAASERDVGIHAT